MWLALFLRSLQTQSSDDHIRGSQDALPVEHEAHLQQATM